MCNKNDKIMGNKTSDHVSREIIYCNTCNVELGNHVTREITFLYISCVTGNKKRSITGDMKLPVSGASSIMEWLLFNFFYSDASLERVSIAFNLIYI